MNALAYPAVMGALRADGRLPQLARLGRVRKIVRPRPRSNPSTASSQLISVSFGVTPLRSLSVCSIKEYLKTHLSAPHPVHNLFCPIEVFTPAFKGPPDGR